MAYQSNPFVNPNERGVELPAVVNSRIWDDGGGAGVGALAGEGRGRDSQKLGCMMKPTWIIFLVVVASFSRAAENGGDLWWPQFRGPNSSGLGGGKPPVHFGPGHNVLWKGRSGQDCRRPSSGESVFS